MTQSIDLKALEKKAWRSVFQDGLWDIFLGLLLMAFALSAWLDRQSLSESMRMGIFIGAEILAMAVLFAGKRFITMPRMGMVKFGAERQKRRNVVRLILFISALVGLAMWFLASLLMNGEGKVLLGRWFFPLVWVLNMLMVFGLGAYFLEYERLYVIGFLYALVIPLDVVIKSMVKVDLDIYIFLTGGLIILAMGVAYLIRFIRDHKPLSLNEG
ncbi:MAG TPA: hypothetical protein VLA72_21310 [Anaerolineales bacterium]|nr:hypothetical protein [Anaerolineales bacterium]